MVDVDDWSFTIEKVGVDKGKCGDKMGNIIFKHGILIFLHFIYDFMRIWSLSGWDYLTLHSSTVFIQCIPDSRELSVCHQLFLCSYSDYASERKIFAGRLTALFPPPLAAWVFNLFYDHKAEVSSNIHIYRFASFSKNVYTVVYFIEVFSKDKQIFDARKHINVY